MSEIAFSLDGLGNLIHAGALQETPAWHIENHAHVFHEMVVLLRGGERIRVGGREIIVHAGDVVLFPSGTAHEEWAEGSGPLETIFLSFRWEGDPAALPLHRFDTHGRIQQMARWLYAEREAYFSEAGAYRQVLLQAVVAEYVRLAAHREQALVEQVRGYVRARIDAPLCLEQLAAQCGLSKYYFARAYRSLTGLSVMEDVRRIRLETARHLLLTTRLPLKAIAQRTGIASEYHLSRLLKKYLGVSARELRGRMKTTAG